MINTEITSADSNLNYRPRRVVCIQFPNSLIISEKGKQLVMNDPNVSFRTLKSLYQSEKALLQDPFLVDFWEKRNYGEVFQKYFMDNRQTGLLHLSMIISGNLEQCMAEIMIQYSDECQIPFIEGAVRIRSYFSVRPFLYYVRTRDSYKTIEWKPTLVSGLKTRIQIPTTKAKKLKNRTYSTRRRAVAQELPNCPLCEARAEIFRCGIGMTEWHVCCESSEHECKNYFGLPPRRTQREASLEWIDYCKRFEV